MFQFKRCYEPLVHPSTLQESAAAARAEPELLDSISDLRVNSFELAGDIREHQRLLAARAAMLCHW